MSTNCFSLCGTKFHILGPKFDKRSVTWYTDLTPGISNQNHFSNCDYFVKHGKGKSCKPWTLLSQEFVHF